MSLIFELGISSADAVQLFPDFDYEAPTIKIQSELRTRSGRSFIYKWGDYDRFEFTCEYMPGSAANVVNSWWQSNTELLFFVTSDSATEVFSVMMMGDKKPFRQFQAPYINKYQGEIILETY